MPETISNPPKREQRARLADWIFAIKVARPGFWLTSAWFYMLPLGHQHVFTHGTFWLGLFYVTFPLGFLLYGWNDVVDYETDRLNPRKGTFLFGARGTPGQLAALPLRIALVQFPFAVIFCILCGSKALAWFAGLVIATALYNLPRYGAKGRPGFDLLNQIGYLLVFVLSSWLNGVQQLPWFTFVFGALFAMHSHLFGEIMDIVPDLRAGRRTTAGVLGVIPSKFLMIAFLVVESALVFVCAHDPLIGSFLALSALWFLLDTVLIWRERLYTAWQMRLFLLGWNAAALISMPFVWWTGTLASMR